MNPETAIQTAILEAVNASGLATLWRNSTGFDAQHRVKYGLCRGSADLIGITARGQFVAFEVKTPTGRATTEQRLFLALVARNGGLARIVRSVEDAMVAIREALKEQI